MRTAAFLGAAFNGFFATDLRATVFRGVAFAADLLLATAFALAAFLGADLCATARVALGRFAAAAGRRLAADFGVAFCEAERDVERLIPLVTALMELQTERARSGVDRCEIRPGEYHNAPSKSTMSGGLQPHRKSQMWLNDPL